jgi:hypothetical protein
LRSIGISTARSAFEDDACKRLYPCGRLIIGTGIPPAAHASAHAVASTLNEKGTRFFYLNQAP